MGIQITVFSDVTLRTLMFRQLLKQVQQNAHGLKRNSVGFLIVDTL